MGLLLFAMFAGGAAGLAGWLMVEPFAPSAVNSVAWQRWEMLYAAIIGGLIGCAIGAVNGYYQGSRAHLVRGALIGLLVGAPGGLIGLQMGGSLSELIVGKGQLGYGIPLPIAILARTLAFIPFGAVVGAAVGATGRSWRQVAVGAMGGALGGALSGMSFDLISTILGPIFLLLKSTPAVTNPGGVPQIEAEVGGPGRAVLAILLGMSVGLFTALFSRLTRTAWIRLVLGRNEGKEWIVDAAQTFIGRNERAHVPLFGDMSIAPMHACIQRNGPQYLLVDGGSPSGTYLNGQRVSQVPLFDGAVIQIGPYQLIFSLRAGAAKRAAEAGMGKPMQSPLSAPPQNTSALPYQQPTYGQAYPGQVTQQVQAVQQAPVHLQAGPPSMPTGTGSVRILHAVDGPMAGRMFEIDASFELGRDVGPIPLAFDTLVSRRHAQFSTGPQGVTLTDLGSTNGTFVNGQKVASTTIRPGDLVKIGVTTFRAE